MILGIKSSLAWPKTNINSGKETALKTEAMATMRNIKNTTTQIIATNKRTDLNSVMVIAKPSNTPKLVATPFPP